MTALGQVVRSGIGRKRSQTIVIGLAAMLSVTASVLGGTLLAVSNAPFENAFARQSGAHLDAQFDGGKTTETELSATADLDGVTEAAGPFFTATVAPTVEVSPGDEGMLPPMTLAGRESAAASVDTIVVTEGRWIETPGEIVISADGPGFPLGATLTFPELPGSPTLTVVGRARSVTQSADAWVLPSVISSFSAAGYQMLYRFDAADTAAEVSAGRAAVASAVPDGALTGSQSWLAVRESATRETAVFVPFLVAFGVLGLIMSVLVVGNVVTGAVEAGTRRIGILKAIGFTPGQVVRAYMAQALVPAAAGAALGVLAGNLLAVPVLSETETAYRTSGLSVSPLVSGGAVVGALAVVTVTALVSARRAGRLRTVDALAVGRASGSGRGRWAERLASRLPMPRPLSLGLGRPFARPARAMAMAAAVAFGAIAVTFTMGLSSSLGVVSGALNPDSDVTVSMAGPEPDALAVENDPSVSPDPDAIAAAIDAQQGTSRYYGSTSLAASVSGLSGAATVTAFTGDASWAGYEMVSGRWFSDTGEAVVPTALLTATGTQVGDTISLQVDNASVTVEIVGEVFDVDDEILLFADASTLADVGAAPSVFNIDLSEGTDVAAYVDALNAELEPLGVIAHAGGADSGSSVADALNALSVLLTLMLATVAALGVLNGVVLDTRERVRELGVYKALGMVPRQTIAMVIASVVVPGLIGAAVGVPLGVALHRTVVPAMGRTGGIELPESVLAVFQSPDLLLLAVAGILVAVLGSLLPAGWAARTRTATALRAE